MYGRLRAILSTSCRCATACLCLLLWHCRGNDSGGGERKSKDTSPKFQQYVVQGEVLYNAHCSNCHQKDGSGLGRVYPPVNASDFIDNNRDQVICLIRNGIKGELVVNGKNFNMAMPPQPNLSDLEVAEIATYLYNTWDRSLGLIDVKEASKVLSSCDTLAR